MKKILYFNILICFLIFISSCEEDYLDKKPLDIISDAQVWDDPALIQAYVVDLYSSANMRGIFRGFTWAENTITPSREVAITDLARTSYDWTNDVSKWNKGLLDASGGMLDYWAYEYMRRMNEFLVLIETGNVADETKNLYSSEVRFLRAFTYLEMVKRYGGVPLLTVPQDITEGDALFVPRNTEKEIFEFIRTECDEIIDLLPDEHEASMKGRTTKYAALALKSRAMLYAASIAKYGSVELNGLVGIPASDADFYWQESYDASNAIIESEAFNLYNAYPDDKAKNYQMLFLDEDNSEIILANKFISQQQGHGFDYFNAPESFKSGWGNLTNVTVEMVDEYEMVDGSSGVIDWANIRGIPSEILKNKDPRFHASIFYHGQPWQGDSIVLYWGIDVDTDGDGINERLSSGNQSYEGMPQVGKDANGGDATKTGFILKKFLDESIIRPKDRESGQDWIVYRYGEILLNFAEAAYELGKTDEALDAINQIRERAGIAEKTSITIDAIRHERKVEMAYECHRWWDLRRWRLSEEALNKDFKSVLAYYDYEDEVFSFEVGNCDGYTRVFKPQHYYMPLSDDIINNNPNLVENPGYR